ncbi:MAG: hypothetical protein ABIN83_08280 [Sphingomicrobium sp.]
MMFWLFNDDKAWFGPKTFGYGAGLPIAWQGWAFLAVHSTLIAGIALLLRDRPPALIIATLTVAFLPLPIYVARTEGGWRWREGGDKS